MCWPTFPFHFVSLRFFLPFLSLDLHGVWRWYTCARSGGPHSKQKGPEQWYPSHIMTTSCFLQLRQIFYRILTEPCVRTGGSSSLPLEKKSLWTAMVWCRRWWKNRRGMVQWRTLGCDFVFFCGFQNLLRCHLGWFSEADELDPNLEGILEWCWIATQLKRVWKIWDAMAVQTWSDAGFHGDPPPGETLQAIDWRLQSDHVHIRLSPNCNAGNTDAKHQFW